MSKWGYLLVEQAVVVRDILGEVRGCGLLAAVEIVEPDGSGHALEATRVAELDRKARDRGDRVGGSALRLAPPLSITEQEVDQLVAIVAERIEEREGDLAR